MLQQKVDRQYEKEVFLKELEAAQDVLFEERLPHSAVRYSLQLTSW
jgi:hypothetical protein